jgi:hypothetical protein
MFFFGEKIGRKHFWPNWRFIESAPGRVAVVAGVGVRDELRHLLYLLLNLENTQDL